MMRMRSNAAVRTYSIGFVEEGFDEAPHARAVAAHLGTAHTELYVRPAEAREVIPDLPMIYDEPFADSSQVPTYLLSKLTREHVTVALSGDGGDELFAGYTRHRFAAAGKQHAGAHGEGIGVRPWRRRSSAMGARVQSPTCGAASKARRRQDAQGSAHVSRRRGERLPESGQRLGRSGRAREWRQGTEGSDLRCGHRTRAAGPAGPHAISRHYHLPSRRHPH